MKDWAKNAGLRVLALGLAVLLWGYLYLSGSQAKETFIQKILGS